MTPRPTRLRSLRRARVIARRHGPRSPEFRRRVALMGGAVTIGLAAVLFAAAADRASEVFARFAQAHRWWPLVLTPTGFAAIAWLTRRFAPAARGSGIPQVMAAQADPALAARTLIAWPVAAWKVALTVAALLVGASVGREGPTVQLAAAVLAVWHRAMRLPMRGSAIIAGGAAGVAAAFNTPLAGVAFAIEELAAAYEQRLAILVMAAILIAGAVSSGIAGDYIYFGSIHAGLSVLGAVPLVLVAGIAGGLAGGLFSRLMQGAALLPATHAIKARPILFAAGCGLAVAAIGCWSGATWGTSYAPARAMLGGEAVPLWFGPAKFVATLATAVAGLPGGIFAPSLATGAGVGNVLRALFPGEPANAVVLLGMVAYFTGVVRAPLTAVFILSETTANRGMILPMVAAALIADQVSQRVCREKLYHGLSKAFTLPKPGAPVA